jgi:DNA-binding transcriptional ArsR family regulator
LSDARQRLEQLEAVCAALAHASRRQILMTVHFRGGMSAGDIAKRFHHAWPTISRHLKVLEEAGLLTHERRGRERVYHVAHDKLDLVREWLSWFDADGKKKRR